MSNLRTKMEEAVRALRAPCEHNSIGVCNTCTLDAHEAVAQSMLTELLERYKKRGEQLEQLCDKFDARGEAMNQNANMVVELQKQLAQINRAIAIDHVAVQMMQGLLSNANVGPYADDKVDAYAHSAVLLADALLRKLEVKS